jgi:two-component system, cell cycle response regulator
LKVLIADDDVISRRLLEAALVRLGHAVVAVADGQEAIAELAGPDAPQLAILDWMMPEVDGLQACRAIRGRADSPYVYIILLTAREGRDNMLAALDAGVDDFLTKPLDVVELRARLRSGTRVIQLQYGLLEAQEALRLEATRDHLTGIWNRRAILEQLHRELRRSRHERRPLSAILADLDHFKAINDRHGHAAGDKVLQESAHRMSTVVRDYDFLGRYGGEEFLLVLPGCDGVTGLDVAERVRQSVTSHPVQVGDVAITVSVSLGIAWTCGTTERVDVLVEAADTALYRAKAAGRNRVESAGEF